MAARPVSEGRGADIQRHADAVARVEAAAAHLRQLPARPQVARPPLGIGFETAAGEHHSGCAKVVDAPAMLHPHAGDAVTVGQQGEGPRAIAHLDAVVARDPRSEENTSELQSLMRNSYAVCR